MIVPFLRSALFLFLAVSVQAGPRQIFFDGVLGNSGEAGDTLVKFSGNAPVGAGVAMDRFGFLWGTGGLGRINRYAVDGRLIGTYQTPAPSDLPKALASTADHIVLLAGGQISALAADAPPGSAFETLNCPADLMSRGVAQGKVALWKAGELSLLNVATREVTSFASVPAAASIELGPDGSVYVESPVRFSARAMQPYGQVSKFNPDGTPAEDWTKDLKGAAPVQIEDHFYTFGRLGTVNRLDLSFASDPGPVLGGMSGSFLGRLTIDPDLGLGTGMVRYRNDAYALAGANGNILLAVWNEGAAELQIERRLGALTQCLGLGLSQEGHVMAAGGSWLDGAGPDTPLQYGTTVGAAGLLQACETKEGTLVAPAFYSSLAGFVVFDFQKNPKFWGIKDQPFSRDAVGAASISLDGKEAIVVAGASGAFPAYRLGTDGRVLQNLGQIPFQTKVPIKKLTSVASDGGTTMLMAVDGFVVEAEIQKGALVEVARWNSWSGDTLGPQITLSLDGDDLWISDAAKNRVLCFERKTRKLIGEYGPKADIPLAEPGVIAARNGQAVVFDQGNQRIQRLQLREK